MKNLKNIITGAIILGLIFFVFSFFVKNNKATDKKNILYVGTNANFPPFEFVKDGKISGFEIDLIHEIGKQLSKEIVLKDMAFDSLLVEAQSGRIDIIASAMTSTVERAKQVLFTKPYLANDPLVIITLANEKPKNVEDLKGKEAIVNDGYTAESYMAKQDGVILKRLATPAEAFFALLSGRGYAYVSARSAVQPFFDKHGGSKFNILTLNVSDSYALAVPKLFPDRFNDVKNALDALESNGTLENLKKKWHLNF